MTSATPAFAHAEATLLVEADSGKVLEAENATFPWHPASLTKVMTAYVTLKAVKDGKITLDTLVTVSPHAAAEKPSKMGFAPGTQLTIDNALKMMMVKSANDMAVVLAEGGGGSVDGFSAMMNQTAARLGMTQTTYVNPNGLPDDRQVTSARDLAMLERNIEQLRTNQQQMASDNAKVIGELKASQEEMKRTLAKVSEQPPPKASAPAVQPAPVVRRPERTYQPPQARARPRYYPREQWYYDDW